MQKQRERRIENDQFEWNGHESKNNLIKNYSDKKPWMDELRNFIQNRQTSNNWYRLPHKVI